MPTIERQAQLRVSVTPPAVSFGAVASGDSVQQTLTLKNESWAPRRVRRLRFLLDGAGNSSSMSLELAGNVYSGSVADIHHLVSGVTLQPGEALDAILTFSPTQDRYDTVRLKFEGDFVSNEVPIDGLGGHQGHPYLHVVIESPDYVVDYDGNGFEPVSLDGTTSHTHEPGRALSLFEWDLGGPVISTNPLASILLGIGSHTATLTIYDDNMPPESLSGSVEVAVHEITDVPGVLAYYYDVRGGDATQLLNAVPPEPDFLEALPAFEVPAGVAVGGSLLHEDVMVRLVADVEIPTDGYYRFVPRGGVARGLIVKGAGKILRANAPGTHSPLHLRAGTYQLDARFAVEEAFTDLPVSVDLSIDEGPLQPFPDSFVSHDESGTLPHINAMPSFGSDFGGNLITIDGFGFFPSASVVVHWGGQDLTQADFQTLTPTKIEFLSPPGTGQISVTVENGDGVSSARSFTYSPVGPVPVNFVLQESLIVFQPTCGVWGYDGSFYVGTRTGEIVELRFDDDWNNTGYTIHDGVSGLINHEILGITVSPYDPLTSPVRLYVSHGHLFLNGGSTFSGPSPYTGTVSMLDGPDFNAPIPLITQLPTSNHDHGVNGLLFDNNGDLLISVGGNTNAGVRHPNSGDLPESPLSGAILKAHTSKPGFNGAVTYVDTITGVPNDDQVFGHLVDVAPGIDVEVHAPGVRNGFDMVLTTKGLLYATDNGPNAGFGAASTSPTTEGPEPTDEDELLLIEYGNYYGHPNRSRGRHDLRQNVYYGSLTGPASIPEEFTQMLAYLPASTNGIDEYRANTFQGQIRGQLFVQEWLDDLRRVELEPDGRGAVAQVSVPPFTAALGVRTGYGGALMVMDYATGRVKVLVPNDLSAVGLVVHDIFPWRAPAAGGAPFTVSGVGFGDLANTTVTIGGTPAPLNYVSSNRIRGFIPDIPNPTTELLDVVVTVDGTPATLTGAFRYLFGPGLEPGRWETLPAAPDPVGEVATAVIDGILYLVGEGTTATYAYDILGGTWLPNRAQRPYPGHHHAAEVVDGKLYLVGGLGGGSEGRVQIYDPATDMWSEGAPMTWAGGSLSTAVISNLIWVAGGIVGNVTVNNFAVYDPVANIWTPRAPMPQGRNHAAAATDGKRMFVFGGRVFGNWVTNGFDTVQIYDPVTNVWDSSDDGGSTLAPLPQARGGMGRAVHYRGEFYVFGGETLDGPGATPDDVYDRVDVYDPVENTWRLEARMLAPRHGIDPVLFQSRMFLPGGGTQAGSSQVTVFDVFTRQ